MRGGGGNGSCGWQTKVCGCARKIVLVRYLLRQVKAQYQIPVQLPVLQGTRELSSADHYRVWPRKRDCNPTVNLATHMRNGLIHFFCHELTKMFEYEKGFLSKHAINRNNKRRFFLLLEELIHRIKPISIHTIITKFNVGYGASLPFPESPN